jgi:hypothetical protein
MKSLRFTLVTDGPSDGVMLIPIFEWLLRTHCGSFGINVVHADLLRCREVPRGLQKKIEFALEAYPCNSLFVHRDAERDSPELRRQEIQKAVESLGAKMCNPHVCVVPVRMTEVWLLFDKAAIRRASGNPNGKVQLTVPPLSSLEDKPDPKQMLHELLITASELSGRRRKSFDPRSRVRLIARSLDDFSPLRQLSAFRELESDVQRLVNERRWNE